MYETIQPRDIPKKDKLVKNGDRYYCTKCDKNYSREDNAVQHFNQDHIGLRKKCNICSKELKIKSFAKHVKTHTKPKKVKLSCELFFEHNCVSSSIVTVEGINYALFPLPPDNELKD